MVLETIDQEVEESQRATHMEYVDMIEKIQEVLSKSEREREKLVDENEELAAALTDQSEKNRLLNKENGILQIAYDNILSEMDACNMKLLNAESEKNELEYKLDETKRRLEKVQRVDAEDSERRIAEFHEKLEALTSDNSLLQERLSRLMSDKSTSEDIQNITQIQLTELADKYKTVSDENDKMRFKIENLYRDKVDLSNMLEASKNEIEDLKREFKYNMERIAIEHANKMKELTNDTKKERERTITGIGKAVLPNMAFIDNDMEDLAFEDNEDDVFHQNLLQQQSIRDFLKRSSMAFNMVGSDLHPSLSDKHIPIQVPTGVDRSARNITSELQFNGELSSKHITTQVPSGREKSNRMIASKHQLDKNQESIYLDQLEEKDKEISRLRDQITEMRENANTGIKSNPKQEEQIKKLTLDLKHEKEKYDMLKNTAENEKAHAEKTIRDFEETFIHSKLAYQMEFAEKEQEILALIKKMKMMAYQIKLYEDQVNEFNIKTKK